MSRRIINAKKSYALVADGDCENWYVQMLKRNEPSIKIDIKPELPQKKTLESQLVKVLELAVDYEHVFWIIDLDTIIKETKECPKGKTTPIKELENAFTEIQKSKNENITTIINTPCLEFWFLLHFENTSKYYEKCANLLPELKKQNILKDYQKSRKFYTQQNNDIYLKLKPFLATAIKNGGNHSFSFGNCCVGISEMGKLLKGCLEW